MVSFFRAVGGVVLLVVQAGIEGSDPIPALTTTTEQVTHIYRLLAGRIRAEQLLGA